MAEARNYRIDVAARQSRMYPRRTIEAKSFRNPAVRQEAEGIVCPSSGSLSPRLLAQRAH